jgi:hypothetical protein
MLLALETPWLPFWFRKAAILTHQALLLLSKAESKLMGSCDKTRAHAPHSGVPDVWHTRSVPHVERPRLELC